MTPLEVVAWRGEPTAPTDPRWDTTPEGRRALTNTAAYLATRTAQEWYDAITAAGVPCGPINTVDGGVALAEELGLDPVVRADDAAAVPTVRNPVTWSATPPSYRRSPPPLGADSAEVRAWLDQNG